LKDKDTTDAEQEEYHCEVCGQKISKEEYEECDGMCWECWDDQFTEESETMFGDVM
jgi:predicted nucleic acid-binding Zn ribbon protein